MGDVDEGAEADVGDVGDAAVGVGEEGLEHPVGGLGEAGGGHDAAVEGVGVVAAGVVEAVPEGAAEVLGRLGQEQGEGGDGVGRVGGVEVVAGLDELGALAPGAVGAGGGVVRAPVVHAVAPLAGEGGAVALGGGGVGLAGGAVGVAEEDVVEPLAAGAGVAGAEVGAQIGLLLDGLDPLLGGLPGIPRFVEDGLPEEEAGAGAVAADHGADVVEDAPAEERLGVPELPAGRVDDDEEPHLVAGVHEGGVLRVVGVAHEGEAGLAQLDGVAVVQQVAHRVADEGEVLVAVGADALAPGLAVEDEPLPGAEAGVAEAEADVHGVGERAVGPQGLHAQEVEGRRVGRPLGGVLDDEGLGHLPALVDAADGALAVEGDARGDAPLALAQALGGQVDAALRAGRGDGHGARLDEPDVAVDAAEVGEVELPLRLAGGVSRVVGVVARHAQDVARWPEPAGDLHMDGVVAAEALGHLLAVEEDFALAHDGLEMEELARALGRPVEALLIGGRPLVVRAAAGLEAHDVEGVRQVHARLEAVAAREIPPHVHRGDRARRALGREIAAARELRRVGEERGGREGKQGGEGSHGGLSRGPRAFGRWAAPRGRSRAA